MPSPDLPPRSLKKCLMILMEEWNKTHCFVEFVYSRVSSIIHLGVSEPLFPTLKLCFASNKDVATFFKYHHDRVDGQYPAAVGMVSNTGEFHHVQGIFGIS